MNIRNASLFAALLFTLSVNAPVRASEEMPLSSATGEMTQEEYAAYRARIREQLEAAQQAEGKAEEVVPQRRNSSGYGQGYRARQERARGNGDMGRVSGRGR
jgi:hypothetical protein